MPVGYVAYIDEAGDDGLKKVYPFYENGSSEWFILSCILVRIENDHSMLEIVKNAISQFSNAQRKDIHYRDLIPAKKSIICQAIADAKVRTFVVMSNKKNMQNYYNAKVASSTQLYTSDKNWFYWWVARCLLERVTEECETTSEADGCTDKKLRIIFSRRGGMNYSHFREYIKKLHWQSQTNALFLKTGDIRWSVIDHSEIYAYDHKSMAGLQLSDVVASAFYQAVAETKTKQCDPQFAKLLKRTVAFRKKRAAYGDEYRHRFDYGIKIMPTLPKANLTVSQNRIFDFYRERDWIGR